MSSLRARPSLGSLGGLAADPDDRDHQPVRERPLIQLDAEGWLAEAAFTQCGGHVPKPVHPFVQLGVKGLSIAHRDPLKPADSSLSYPRPPSQPRVSAEPAGRSGEAAWPRLGRGGGVVSVSPTVEDRRRRRQ